MLGPTAWRIRVNAWMSWAGLMPALIFRMVKPSFSTRSRASAAIASGVSIPTVMSVTIWFTLPPSTLYRGWPISLPLMSYRAISTAAFAEVLPDSRRSIMQWMPSISNGSMPISPVRNSFSASSTVAVLSPVTGSKGAASPMPHRPSSVVIFTSTFTEWSCTAKAIRKGFFIGM